VASLVLGLLALPLIFFAGVPALLIGYRGLWFINANEGQLRGRGLAVAGMVLGGVGCLLGIALGLLLLFGRLQSAAGRAECTNNLRLIGLAIEQYQVNHNHTYPPGTVPNPALAPEERLSWLTEILPSLNRRNIPDPKWHALLDSIDPEQGWKAPVDALARDTTIRTFLCPGYPDNAQRSVPGLTDYIGLAGIGNDAPSLPLDSPQAGFFGYNRIVTLEQVKLELSTTLIVTETTRDNGPWIAGGPATVRGIDPEDTPLIGTDRPLGGCHFGDKGEPGLNTLWLDGSVRYLTAAKPVDQLVEQIRINHPRK
jgi:hypothetical protein